MKDKSGRLASIPQQPHVCLELGCGGNKRHHAAIGIDRRDLPGVDVVGDVHDALARVPAASVDEIYSYHFVEHVDEVERLVLELKRIVKVGGTVTTVVPHFSNPYFYSDYTHRHAFGLYSFSYLAEDHILRRRVPRYVPDTGFSLHRVRLIFKAPPPFYVRYAIGRVLGFLINSSRFMKEFYEGTLSPWLPCYEIEFVLVRLGP